MGHVADIRRPASHDDSGSYGGDDSEVEITRPAAGTPHQLPRGDKTRGGASSQEVACRFAVSSWTASRSRLAPRRPEKFRKAQLRRPERPSRTEILGLR
jgi:hypothetical protein